MFAQEIEKKCPCFYWVLVRILSSILNMQILQYLIGWATPKLSAIWVQSAGGHVQNGQVTFVFNKVLKEHFDTNG